MKKEKNKRALRIVHITDVHIQPELKAAQGLVNCLDQIYSLKDKPDLILNGGDMVMETLGVDKSRAKEQWDLWKSVIKDYRDIPIVHCIGNHDVWGWDKKNSKCTGREIHYGKKWVMKACELTKRYWSFDKAGWHFIVLDSTHTRISGRHAYTAKLDEEQFDWLADDLKSTSSKKPILILSHIPILSGCAFLDGENEKSGDWRVPGAWVHIDARRIKNLFLKHPNIKLCISGHLHLFERLDYNNVTYICNGSVCGNWWKGDYQETQPGYGLIDLYKNGTFEYQYIPTGWKPKK